MNVKTMLFASILVVAAAPVAAQTAYTNQAAFNAATVGTSFTLQSFEGTPTSTATSLSFGNVTFNCNGNTFCPGFFGQSTAFATDGSYSVFFATPDTATFTFNTAINAFGIDVIGLGDVGTTNFFVNVGTGPLALQQNYSATGGTVAFAGVTSATGFTTVTFSGSQASDGIFFDRLRFGANATGGVPEPATWAMMIMGFGLVGGAMRRRSIKVAYA